MATRIAMETYSGHVKSPSDAIILFEACRLGLLPRVQRRLSEKERHQIRSGSIFVWDEREAGMRRWTDGKSWSASRVSGSFLTYREMEGKRGANTFTAPAPPSGRDSSGDPDGDGLDGEGPDGYRYKPDGLIKQSFSIKTAQNQHLHLISYFSRADASSSTRLKQPSKDPDLCSIRPPKDMYPESSMHDSSSMPAVTRGPMPNMAGYAHSPSGRPLGPQEYLRHPSYMHPGASPHVAPGYPWPPSPMHTPPIAPQHYSPYVHVHPGASPYNPYYDPHMRAANPPPGPGPTVFDRPPTQTHPSTLPPPPPPPTSQIPPIAPGYPHHHHQPPPHDYPPYHPPPLHHRSDSHTGASAYPTPTTSTPSHPPYDKPASQSTPTREAPPLPRAHSAGTIPSINSLINGPTSPVRTSPGRTAPLRPPSEMVLANSSAGRSEGEKVAFQADKAALRQLDRAFAA